MLPTAGSASLESLSQIGPASAGPLTTKQPAWISAPSSDLTTICIEPVAGSGVISAVGLAGCSGFVSVGVIVGASAVGVAATSVGVDVSVGCSVAASVAVAVSVGSSVAV